MFKNHDIRERDAGYSKYVVSAASRIQAMPMKLNKGC